MKMQQSKVSVKYSEENFVFISLSYSNLFNFWGGGSGKGGGVGWGGAGRLFEAGHLLTFSAFRMGTYSRWVLIRG